jgi:hypothetical protein
VTILAYNEPRFTSLAAGNPSADKLTKAQYRGAIWAQRRKARIAFSRSFARAASAAGSWRDVVRWP